MFTGIIETRATVKAVTDRPGLRRISIDYAPTNVKHGDSIAINGCCLTVADQTDLSLSFDVIAETLAKTNIGSLQAGDAVNIERALRVGDRLDGHFVQGHVDGVAELLRVTTVGDDWRLTVATPPLLRPYLIPKGSVAIDGVSLTLADVRGDEFDVALIPTTLELTTLGSRVAGWKFNLEADVFSKTIVSYLQRMNLPSVA